MLIIQIYVFFITYTVYECDGIFNWSWPQYVNLFTPIHGAICYAEYFTLCVQTHHWCLHPYMSTVTQISFHVILYISVCIGYVMCASIWCWSSQTSGAMGPKRFSIVTGMQCIYIYIRMNKHVRFNVFEKCILNFFIAHCSALHSLSDVHTHLSCQLVFVLPPPVGRPGYFLLALNFSHLPLFASHIYF